MTKPTRRVCPNGHTYYKSSDCPVCPVCSEAERPADDFLSRLSAPARRALQAEGITSAEKLSAYRRLDILALHGVGPSSIPKLEAALSEAGLSWKTH